MKKNPDKNLTPTKVYHIYLKNECIFSNIKEDEFRTTWTTLNSIVGLMKTDYNIEDLSYEELTVQKLEECSY
jgi:hypothetical protein